MSEEFRAITGTVSCNVTVPNDLPIRLDFFEDMQLLLVYPPETKVTIVPEGARRVGRRDQWIGGGVVTVDNGVSAQSGWHHINSWKVIYALPVVSSGNRNGTPTDPQGTGAYAKFWESVGGRLTEYSKAASPLGEIAGNKPQVPKKDTEYFKFPRPPSDDLEDTDGVQVTYDRTSGLFYFSKPCYAAIWYDGFYAPMEAYTTIGMPIPPRNTALFEINAETIKKALQDELLNLLAHNTWGAAKDARGLQTQNIYDMFNTNMKALADPTTVLNIQKKLLDHYGNTGGGVTRGVAIGMRWPQDPTLPPKVSTKNLTYTPPSITTKLDESATKVDWEGYRITTPTILTPDGEYAQPPGWNSPGYSKENAYGPGLEGPDKDGAWVSKNVTLEVGRVNEEGGHRIAQNSFPNIQGLQYMSDGDIAYHIHMASNPGAPEEAWDTVKSLAAERQSEYGATIASAQVGAGSGSAG